MAINTELKKLTEAELNDPDLDDDGEINVESYPLPSGDEIEDPYLAEVWKAAVKQVNQGLADENQLAKTPPVPSSPFGKSLDNYAMKKECHWVTMPANGEGGGGSPVCIDGSGKINKGPSKLTGNKPSELKKPSIPKIKPSPFKKPEKSKESPSTSSEKTDTKPAGSKPDYVGKPIQYTTKDYQVSKDLDLFGKKASDGLTPTQMDAVYRYSGDDYVSINRAMRKCPPDFHCVGGTERKQMELIEEALAEAPPLPEPTMVYRGITNTPQGIQDTINLARQAMENGGEYRMPSITSTTLDPAVSIMAFGSTHLNHSVVFQIRAKRGLYINSFSEHNHEHEVIQSSKTRYRVAGVEVVDFVEGDKPGRKGNVIYLEELD